jgi:DNA-binding transcriptional MerR regulator
MQLANLSIASVSLDTGIGKEVLRKWESRYGFPVPQRDALGNRVYSIEQLGRLRLIKRLMDGGMRPSDVVSLEHDNLLTLVERRKHRLDANESNGSSQIINWLKLRDPEFLRQKLHAELLAVGLNNFIVDVMPGMNGQLGNAWECGDIAIRDEHLYSEISQELLRTAIASISDPNGYPRVMITTPGGELHTLGILMLQGFLSLRGAYCLSLGAQTPVAEIGLAVQDYRADIVGLSFSASFPQRRTMPMLKEVRAVLPAEKELWAGGQGISGIQKSPRGIRLLHRFEDIEDALDDYREKNPRV